MAFEWCMKTEYQGRGTPHWHICAWIMYFGPLPHLAGRTGTAVVSAFVKFLYLLFNCEVHVQYVPKDMYVELPCELRMAKEHIRV